jgi:hypothetical protein
LVILQQVVTSVFKALFQTLDEALHSDRPYPAGTLRRCLGGPAALAQFRVCPENCATDRPEVELNCRPRRGSLIGQTPRVPDRTVARFRSPIRPKEQRTDCEKAKGATRLASRQARQKAVRDAPLNCGSFNVPPPAPVQPPSTLRPHPRSGIHLTHPPPTWRTLTRSGFPVVKKCEVWANHWRGPCRDRRRLSASASLRRRCLRGQ